MAHFKYVEKNTTSQKLLNTLKEEITGFSAFPYEPTAGEEEELNNWQVHSEVADVNGNLQELILKGIIKIGDGATPLTKDIYLKFINHALVSRTYPSSATTLTYTEHSSLSVQILDGYSDVDGTFSYEGHPVLFQWADEDYTPTDRNATKPVYLYLNITNNRLALCLVADPAVNFEDYRKAFMYAGAINPFEYNMDDVEGNVLLTGGSVIAPPDSTTIASEGTYYFGEYTSTGNDTFQMLFTKSGIEFQKHYPAFITQAPPVGMAYNDPILGDTGLELEQQGFQASKWTQKYHLSPIYVVHPYEGYRGQLQDCIAVTKHNILHLDELIIDVEGKPWKQEVYRYFDINTEYNFMKLSPNQNMSVAFLKEVRY